MFKSSLLFTASLFLLSSLTVKAIPGDDQPYIQAKSVKYSLPEALKGTPLKKVVVDYNDNAYVLTPKGVFRNDEKGLVKDQRYTPLADKIPVDISVQEGSGHLFYLYADKWLTLWSST
jgi:hypothetical protein